MCSRRTLLTTTTLYPHAHQQSTVGIRVPYTNIGRCSSSNVPGCAFILCTNSRSCIGCKKVLCLLTDLPARCLLQVVHWTSHGMRYPVPRDAHYQFSASHPFVCSYTAQLTAAPGPIMAILAPNPLKNARGPSRCSSCFVSPAIVTGSSPRPLSTYRRTRNTFTGAVFHTHTESDWASKHCSRTASAACHPTRCAGSVHYRRQEWHNTPCNVAEP